MYQRNQILLRLNPTSHNLYFLPKFRPSHRIPPIFGFLPQFTGGAPGGPSLSGYGNTFIPPGGLVGVTLCDTVTGARPAATGGVPGGGGPLIGVFGGTGGGSFGLCGRGFSMSGKL